MNIQWIDIREQEIPFDDTGILVSHRYGVEYIVWFRRAWRYAYSGKPIGELINGITHWCKPQKVDAKTLK